MSKLSETPQRRVEIAGAGFAGLTAAIAFARVGWSVRVHEAAPELREFGAGILLWENSLRALDELGVGDSIRAIAHRPPFYETRKNGTSVSLELGGVPFWTVSRPNLHRLLVDAAIKEGVELLTDSRVASVDSAGSLTLDSGETIEADLVIGADGAGSVVRASLPLEQERKRYRDGVARLLVSRPAEFNAPEWDRMIDFWTFEPDVMRVLYVPLGPDQVYLGLMAETANEAASRIPIDAEIWSTRFPELRPMLELAAHAEGGRHDSYQTLTVTPWSSGRVALVGDSAHAMCPALAQGAGVAISNAYSLAMEMHGAEDLPAALERWERTNRPITDRTQSRSAFMAESRSFGEGNGWTDETLETARFDPTTAFAQHVTAL